MKKVLYIASGYGHLRSFHTPYIADLMKRGYEVHTAAGGDSGALGAECMKAVVKHRIDFQKKMLSPQNIKCVMQLIKLMKMEKYDIISVHTSLAAFFTRLAVMLMQKIGTSNRPIVINTVHGYLFDNASPKLKRRILLGAEKLTRSVTDILVVMNEQDREIARKYHLYKEQLYRIKGFGIDTQRFSKEHVEHILMERLDDNAPVEDTSPVDDTYFADDFFDKNRLIKSQEIRQYFREQLGFKEHDVVMIYAAEFSGRKNQQMLIEAMKLLPEHYKLVLAGQGDLLEKCKSAALNLGLWSRNSEGDRHKKDNRVLFAGHLSNLEKYYYLSDICVSSSRSEGLPFNIMEAMAMGLPVVATNVKGHEDLIENGKNGFLYGFGDCKGFAEAILALSINGALSLKNLTEISRANVERAQNYSLEAVKEEVMRAYEAAEKTCKANV